MENKRILIVDDDEEMCEELKEALSFEGYSVSAVYDGEKAQIAIQKNEYELILLDLKMPQIDGRQVLKYLKEKHPEIKIIILTGSPLSKKLLSEKEEDPSFGLDDHRSVVLQLADAIINKPFDMKSVLIKIKEIIGRQ